MNRNPEDRPTFNLREHTGKIAVVMAGLAIGAFAVEAHGHTTTNKPNTVISIQNDLTSNAELDTYQPVNLDCPAVIPEGTIVNIAATKNTDGVGLRNKVFVNNILLCASGNGLFSAKVTEMDKAETHKHGSSYSTTLTPEKTKTVTLDLLATNIVSPLVESNDAADEAPLKLNESEAAYDSLVENLTKNGKGFLRNNTYLNAKLSKGFSVSTLSKMDAHISEMAETAARLDTDLSMAVVPPQGVSTALSGLEKQAETQLSKEYKSSTIHVELTPAVSTKELQKVINDDDALLSLYKSVRFTNTKNGSTELVLIESDGIRTTVEDPSLSLNSTQIGSANAELKTNGYN